MSSARGTKQAILLNCGGVFKLIPVRKANQFVDFKSIPQVPAQIKRQLEKLETMTAEEKKQVKAIQKGETAEEKKKKEKDTPEKGKDNPPTSSVREILEKKEEDRVRKKRQVSISPSHLGNGQC